MGGACPIDAPPHHHAAVGLASAAPSMHCICHRVYPPATIILSQEACDLGTPEQQSHAHLNHIRAIKKLWYSGRLERNSNSLVLAMLSRMRIEDSAKLPTKSMLPRYKSHCTSEVHVDASSVPSASCEQRPRCTSKRSPDQLCHSR